MTEAELTKAEFEKELNRALDSMWDRFIEDWVFNAVYGDCFIHLKFPRKSSYL